MKIKQRKRSSTVPNTPIHHNNTNSNTVIVADATIMNSTITESNNNNTSRTGFYWEGFSPHFMLPTYAITCRTFKHHNIERCPRACKGK